MWWHADDSTYGLLLQGLATSPNISGPYTFVSATSPLGNWSQDFDIFTNYKDGRTFSLYSNGDRKEGRDVYITRFNEEVTALEGVVHRFDKFDLEAPTIVQTDQSYYALMSHKTGYRPNSELLCLIILEVVERGLLMCMSGEQTSWLSVATHSVGLGLSLLLSRRLVLGHSIRSLASR